MVDPSRNLELKAPCADLGQAQDRLIAFGARLAGVEEQRDTFFPVPHGRLKLREITGQPAVLIHYHRPNDPAIRSSHYHLVPVADASLLQSALAAALGVRGVVLKTRTIF